MPTKTGLEIKMRRANHISNLTKSPQRAQTVQQLKYETLLVYLSNGISLTFGMFANLGETSNAIQGLIGVLPYKSFYNGGDGTSGGTTS
jgi:hypothetical protein